MKKVFENILKEHGIYGEDVEEILYAVQDMLEAVARSVEEVAPYATNTLKRLETASYEVFGLTNYMHEE
jgi:hypothetical protein